MLYPQFTTLPVRMRDCRPLQRHFRDVTLTPARITDITLSRMTRAGSHFVPRIRHTLPTRKVKKVEKVKHLWTIHTLRSLPDQGGRCVQSLVQIGSEMWICIRYKQTNKQTNKLSALYTTFFYHFLKGTCTICLWKAIKYLTDTEGGKIFFDWPSQNKVNLMYQENWFKRNILSTAWQLTRHSYSSSAVNIVCNSDRGSQIRFRIRVQIFQLSTAVLDFYLYRRPISCSHSCNTAVLLLSLHFNLHR